ncbi:DeoR/GlpR transcriptional regulator [Vibrio cholerae]
MNKCPAEQRQRLLLDMLEVEGSINASEVALQLNTTGATVRRDLNQLASKGLCKRTHGGAIRLTPATGSFDERSKQLVREKQKLGELASSLLQPNQLIFIDASSANVSLAERIPLDMGITVVTNSLHVALCLFNRGFTETILVGGKVDNNVGGAIDTKALSDITGFYFHIVFIGVCAWSKEHGFSALNYADAQFKQQLVKQGGLSVVLFTQDKTETYAPYALMETSQVDYLVCGKQDCLKDLTLEVTNHGGQVLYT